ncbi:oplophorus-luciferin 2-monooxygenase non-catalytic subunit-like [Penaeus chinensis]|uniref:oplophorus-luciferin 2-monooxygenase non-catalytic subunit-like n=1 Tax=Penaeus chinensis TaxID=139456 RepID=UPI001FB5E3A6|nr:oplophorus-luciferin 2-monooxygenase non-catalytic subunit-like [Penaeus chinensis]
MAELYCLLAFLALALGSVAVSVAEDGAKDAELRSLSCPDPQDISPCVCTVDLQHNMDIDCSQVESEDQLAQVFSSNIPFPTFQKLLIDRNKNLRVLRNGDLGPASFQIIEIVHGILEEVQDGALSHSYSTATRIDLQVNKLTKFPFHEIPSFTSLSSLWLSLNSFSEFPSITSDSLTDIQLNTNFISEIPLTGFQGVKNVKTIGVGLNDITTIAPGTFTDLPHLDTLFLFSNELSEIPAGAIAFSGRGYIYFHKNNISKVAVGAIKGLGNGNIDLSENSLTILDEEVFGAFLSAGATLNIDDNPLGCGCEIAWLITNSAYMSLITTGASCYDGEMLVNLDPTIYEDFC